MVTVKYLTLRYVYSAVAGSSYEEQLTDFVRANEEKLGKVISVSVSNIHPAEAYAIITFRKES